MGLPDEVEDEENDSTDEEIDREELINSAGSFQPETPGVTAGILSSLPSLTGRRASSPDPAPTSLASRSKLIDIVSLREEAGNNNPDVVKENGSSK